MTLAIVFPGQGSQAVGMMAGFDAHPAIRATFDEASSVLGQDLWALVTSGPESDLNQTINTQPAMLTVGVAVWRAWRAAGGAAPVIVAGHSLGEYSALVAAGALDFRDALPLVRYRAQAMQEAVPAGVGAMAAILGLDAAGRRGRLRRGCGRSCQRAHRGAGQFQRAGADRDSRAQGRGRARASPLRRNAGRKRVFCCRSPRLSTARC